jgi:copper chaperone CopZ
MKTLFITVTLLVSLSISAFANHSAGTVYADVNGLVCDYCARSLEKVFLKHEAVEFIDVDLDEKVITIHFNEGKRLDHETITQLITDSGFDVLKIRHGG